VEAEDNADLYAAEADPTSEQEMPTPLPWVGCEVGVGISVFPVAVGVGISVFPVAVGIGVCVFPVAVGPPNSFGSLK